MDKLDILVVGGGGREHAIINKLRESPRCGRLYACPGNGGISGIAECLPISATDIEGVVALSLEKAVDLVVVAPDDPLVMGMVDALNAEGIRAFGPNKAAAIIEGSKAFSKSLMKKYAIPTADYELFEQPDAAIDYIKSENRFPVVIKADGLALGKGVIIAESLNEAESAIKDMMENKIFGKSGSRVVVEEFLTGPEVTVLAFCDGESVIPMVSSMDHKRAGEGNTGPNTGGMGVIAPNPHYTAEMAALCEETIFIPTLKAMAAEGRPFKGCLYFGLMLTPTGPKVIEYNCRFGDPETQAVLPLLESDLIDIMLAITDGSLKELDIRFNKAATACVIMASGGYPGSYNKGLPITGICDAEQIENVTVYQAGTAKDAAGQLVTSGGRVLGVTAMAQSLESALKAAYKAVATISFEGAFYRRDIGRY